jgi:hypothetical protein
LLKTAQLCIFLLIPLLLLGGLLAIPLSSAINDTHHNISSSGVIMYPSQPPSNGPWRPFSDDSIWNTKIPANAALHPNSEQMIEWLQGLQYKTFGINIHSWSIPVYDAYASTPRVDIYVTADEVSKVDELYGGIYHSNVPFPTGAQPDPMSDHHMIVVDWSTNTEWDYIGLVWHQAETINGHSFPARWVADACIPWELYGNGVMSQPISTWGARGSSIPNLGGLIRPEEIEAGVIPHALCFGCCYPKHGYKVYPPAATTDGKSTDPNAIPEGARLQLDPTLNLDSLGLSRAGKIIAKCMQEYGIILVDCTDGLPLYAENPLGRASDPWAALGFDGSSASPIPLDFRVINYAVFGAVEEPFS